MDFVSYVHRIVIQVNDGDGWTLEVMGDRANEMLRHDASKQRLAGGAATGKLLIATDFLQLSLMRLRHFRLARRASY
jgi:hypothetical protein